jgi:hypothetical protein
MAPPRESALPSLWSRVYYAVSAPINMLHCFGRSLSVCVTYASESLWRDKVMRYLAPRIAAIGMLSLYLPFISRRGSGQFLRRRLRLRSCDQHSIRTSVHIGGVFSSETGKEGSAWSVVVY